MIHRFIPVLAVVVLLGACGSGDSEPSLSDTLTESMWETHAGFYQAYHDDGTYAVTTTMAKAEGDVSAADVEWGTWSLDENVLSLTTNAESGYCAGVSAAYLLEVVDDGNRIEVTLQDDTCQVRSVGFPPGVTRAGSSSATAESTTVMQPTATTLSAPSTTAGREQQTGIAYATWEDQTLTLDIQAPAGTGDPGVYRVLHDGVRDLTSVDASHVVASYDGGIRLLREDGFLQLGIDRFHQWPDGVTAVSHVFEVAPDATMWVIPRYDPDYPNDPDYPDPTWRAGTGLRSTDGEKWTAQPCPDECFGVTVAPDGSVWASWGATVGGKGPIVGRLGPSGWEPDAGRTPPANWNSFLLLFPTEAGDLYAWAADWFDTLYRYEDGRYEDGRWEDGSWGLFAPGHWFVDVTWDGTVWLDGLFVSLFDADLESFPGAGLTRVRDGERERWTAADLPQIEFGFGYDHQFEAAPDGSVWFSLWRSADGRDPRRGTYESHGWWWEERKAAVKDGRMVCDGLARFDGETLHQFFPDQCVSMDIAADGSAWVLSDVGKGKALYVITPEAFADAD